MKPEKQVEQENHRLNCTQGKETKNYPAMTETYTIVHYERNGHDIFQEWLDGLRGMKARNAIQKRIDRIQDGNFGNHHSCRDGVSELVIDTGGLSRLLFYCREYCCSFALRGR